MLPILFIKEENPISIAYWKLPSRVLKAKQQIGALLAPKHFLLSENNLLREGQSSTLLTNILATPEKDK